MISSSHAVGNDRHALVMGEKIDGMYCFFNYITNILLLCFGVACIDNYI